MRSYHGCDKRGSDLWSTTTRRFPWRRKWWFCFRHLGGRIDLTKDGFSFFKPVHRSCWSKFQLAWVYWSRRVRRHQGGTRQSNWQAQGRTDQPWVALQGEVDALKKQLKAAKLVDGTGLVMVPETKIEALKPKEIKGERSSWCWELHLEDGGLLWW